jgi:hypothetical protein
MSFIRDILSHYAGCRILAWLALCYLYGRHLELLHFLCSPINLVTLDGHYYLLMSKTHDKRTDLKFAKCSETVTTSSYDYCPFRIHQLFILL